MNSKLPEIVTMTIDIKKRIERFSTMTMNDMLAMNDDEINNCHGLLSDMDMLSHQLDGEQTAIYKRIWGNPELKDDDPVVLEAVNDALGIEPVITIENSGTKVGLEPSAITIENSAEVAGKMVDVLEDIPGTEASKVADNRELYVMRTMTLESDKPIWVAFDKKRKLFGKISTTKQALIQRWIKTYGKTFDSITRYQGIARPSEFVATMADVQHPVDRSHLNLPERCGHDTPTLGCAGGCNNLA